MTNKRDLKALVRERMAKTGESYMQAKQAVLNAAKGARKETLLAVDATNATPEQIAALMAEAHRLDPSIEVKMVTTGVPDTACSCAWEDEEHDPYCLFHEPASVPSGLTSEEYRAIRDAREAFAESLPEEDRMFGNIDWNRTTKRWEVAGASDAGRCVVGDSYDYGECVLPNGHRSDEHGDDHQSPDGTWWNVGRSNEKTEPPKGKRVECIFCSEGFDTVRELKIHSARCQKHPAVIEARRLRLLGSLTVVELTEKLADIESKLRSAGVPEKLLQHGPDDSDAARVLAQYDAVALRGFGDLVPEQFAEWAEVARALARAEMRAEREQEAAYATAARVAAPPEEILYRSGGRVFSVTRTAAEAAMMEEAREIAGKVAALGLPNPLNGPRPTDLMFSDSDAYRELVEQAKAVMPDPRANGCICPDPEYGTEAGCKFHHPPIVTEPKVTEPEGVVAKGGLSEPGSVDVARKLLDKAVEARGAGGAKSILTARIDETIDVVKAAREASSAVGLRPSCPPIVNGVCVYCGRMPHACKCDADPPGTSYARCTNCDLTYKLFPTKSRTCERCHHSPVEILDHVKRCTVRSSITDDLCVLADGHGPHRPDRFHQFPSRADSPLSGFVMGRDGRCIKCQKFPNDCRCEALTMAEVTRAMDEAVRPKVEAVEAQFRFNGRTFPMDREPTFTELLPLAMSEAVPACSCGGATRIGPGAEVLHDDPDCAFHHPLTAEDSRFYVPVEVVLNGMPGKLPRWVTYERLMRELKIDPERSLSVTYRSKTKSGTLWRGKAAVFVEEGAIFNAMATGNA